MVEKTHVNSLKKSIDKFQKGVTDFIHWSYQTHNEQIIDLLDIDMLPSSLYKVSELLMEIKLEDDIEQGKDKLQIYQAIRKILLSQERTRVFSDDIVHEIESFCSRIHEKEEIVQKNGVFFRRERINRSKTVFAMKKMEGRKKLYSVDTYEETADKENPSQTLNDDLEKLDLIVEISLQENTSSLLNRKINTRKIYLNNPKLMSAPNIREPTNPKLSLNN